MNPEFESFFEFLEVERHLAPNTQAAYRNDLNQFDEYLRSERATRFLEGVKLTDPAGIAPSLATRDAILDFFIYLKDERRYSAATIARKMAAVKSLFQFLVRRGSVSINPVADVGSPEVKKVLPKPLSLEDVSNLMTQVEKRLNPEGLRDCAMLRLLYATGMRVTEMVSLNVGDVNLEDPTIQCVGRGNRIRVLPIDEDTTAAVHTYMGSGRDLLLRGSDMTALFLNHRGQRLTRQGFWLIMKGLARDAGLPLQVTPHTLRHSFAAHRLSAGTPLPRLRYLLGHANLSTTQIYRQLGEIGQAVKDEPVPAGSAR